MGSYLSIFSMCPRILVVGLPNSGKSTIIAKIYQVRPMARDPPFYPECNVPIPSTSSFSTPWKDFWRICTSRIIFIVDASDDGMLKEAAVVVKRVLKDEMYNGAKV